MDRRALLYGGAAFICSGAVVGGATVTFGAVGQASVAEAARDEDFLITRSDAEWRSKLNKLEYEVMREGGTERAGSSVLHRETSEGTYHCKGCNLALYSSDAKFDSGKGWPSFSESLPNAIGTREDDTFFTRRREVHCRRCGSHIGHIFTDGPPPTGERHSLNGVSLIFVTAAEADMFLRRRSHRVLKA